MNYKDILNLKFDKENYNDIKTIGDFLKKIFKTLWSEGECFNSKRPLGNSDWEWEVYYILVKNKIIEGTLKEDDVDIVDFYKADKIILELIDYIFNKAQNE